jgi:hypothetical protein
MLETQSVSELIEQQIQIAVTQQVTERLDQTDWISEIESRITKHVQDRITARFSNISTIPDLIATVQNSVIDLVDQGHLLNLEAHINPSKLDLLVDQSIQRFIDSAIDNLVIDPEWLGKIERSVNLLMTQRVLERLSALDIDALLVQQIDAGLERWQHRLNQKFPGLDDQAEYTELRIMPGGVSVENTLVARSAVIGEDAEISGTLKVNNLAIQGSINVDNHSWLELASNVSDITLDQLNQQWRETMVREVLDLSRTQGIDFASVTVNDQPLVQGDSLGAAIKNSNLEQIGTLRNLAVSGPADIASTLRVRSGRIGINTDSPDMAMSIWDEEVCLSLGKLSKQQAYLGTSRLQKLAIGVNRTGYLEIDTDGLVTVSSLKVGNYRISHAAKVPGHSGARGDIVFNSDPRPGEPFAWQCLGAYQWQPLRAMP